MNLDEFTLHEVAAVRDALTDAFTQRIDSLKDSDGKIASDVFVKISQAWMVELIRHACLISLMAIDGNDKRSAAEVDCALRRMGHAAIEAMKANANRAGVN